MSPPLRHGSKRDVVFATAITNVIHPDSGGSKALSGSPYLSSKKKTSYMGMSSAHLSGKVFF